MDTTTLLNQLPQSWSSYITMAVTVAGIICVVAPAPKGTSGAWYEIYQIINRIALNFGHAQSLSAPESTGVVGGSGSISKPMITTGTVPLATASPEQKAVMVPPTAPVPPVGAKP